MSRGGTGTTRKLAFQVQMWRVDDYLESNPRRTAQHFSPACFSLVGDTLPKTVARKIMKIMDTPSALLLFLGVISASIPASAGQDSSKPPPAPRPAANESSGA